MITVDRRWELERYDGHVIISLDEHDHVSFVPHGLSDEEYIAKAKKVVEFYNTQQVVDVVRLDR